MSENLFIKRIPRSNNSTASTTAECIVIQTTWLPSEVSIALLCPVSETGYSAHLAYAQLEATAHRLEIPFEDFLAQTKAALTQSIDAASAASDFVFELKDAQFTWRKRISDQLKIIYGSVSLTATPRIQFDLLPKLLDIQQSQQHELNQMAGETKRLLDDNAKLHVVLEQCLAEKTNLEQELLRKFLALINGKKGRIVELEEELRVLRQTENRNRNKSKRGDSIRSPSDLLVDATAMGDTTDDESDVEYRNGQRFDSMLLKRLNSDSSQASQETSGKVLPKRLKVATQAHHGRDEAKNPVAIDAESHHISPASPHQCSAEIYECDTQHIIGDM